MNAEDRCPATNRNGERCGHPAGWGTDNDTGPCKYHGGLGGDVGDERGAPEGNQNATRHGIHSDPANVLDDLAENNPKAYEWVERKHDSYLDTAPFELGSGKADQLRMICVREYCVWRATGVQVRDGMLKKTHIQGSDGELHEVEDEHSINIAIDRAERTITRRLKELGILDDPDSAQAGATDNLAAAIEEKLG